MIMIVFLFGLLAIYAAYALYEMIVVLREYFDKEDED